MAYDVLSGSLAHNINSHFPSKPGLFQQFWEKGPWPKLGKMIDLTSKLGQINNIEHNKDSKMRSGKFLKFLLVLHVHLKYAFVKIQ